MSIKKKTLKSGIKYSFTLRYKDIYGNTKQYTSKGYNTKREAELEEAKFRIKIQEKKTTFTSITFKDVYQEYIEYKSKLVKLQTLNKIKELSKYLQPIMDVKVNDLDLATYNKFNLYVDKEGYSVNHKNKILNLLKSLVNYSHKYYNTSDTILTFIENYKEVNPFKKEMQFFTYEEFLKFESVIDELDYKTFFEVLYYLGLRQGEACSLTWSDIDFNKSEVSINKTITTKLKGQLYTISSPKTKKSNRVLPIPKKLLESLKIIKNNAKKKKYFKESWFVFGDELPFRETTIQVRKNKYCRLAGVKQIRIHDFRHSCASFLIQNGASIVLVSKYLGHSKISITLDTYTHLYENELKKVSSLIDTL
jgi:integrase